MSKIPDFGCQVDACKNDAAEIIETDNDELVLLCRTHHDTDVDGWHYGVMDIKGQTLMRDTAGSWFFLPERIA